MHACSIRPARPEIGVGVLPVLPYYPYRTWQEPYMYMYIMYMYVRLSS